jgi:ubiquinone/menaquinone biosynthesis C-methylase UbiE
MTIPINTHEMAEPYVIDPQEAEAAERLLLQDRAITKELGGLFPAGFLPSAGQVILDLACGPGGWALDVARAHPQIEVIGIDQAQQLIRFARAQARAQELPNVSFQVGDILKLLAFPEETFALLNARFLSTLLTKDAWLSLMRECFRVLQPGGALCLIDGEWAYSTGVASEHYAALLKRAMWLSGRSFSPEGSNMHGITLMLSHFLRQVGLNTIEHHAYALDYSYGTAGHAIWYRNTVMAFPRVTPWVVGMGLITLEECERLCVRVAEEMQEPDFRAMLFFLRVSGVKPEHV